MERRNKAVQDFRFPLNNLIYGLSVYVIVSDVISVRVRKDLKRRAEELGIDIRGVLEEALEKAIKEKEREEIINLSRRIRELMSNVTEEDWVKDVKETRNER